MSNENLDSLLEDWSCALAIVAHPDDMEFGAASAVARWTSQGKKVVYILMTSGEAGIDGMSPQEAGPIREEEEYKSASVVGVEKVDFLGYADGVIEYDLPLRRDIARQIRIHKPEVLITLSASPDLAWRPSQYGGPQMAGLRRNGRCQRRGEPLDFS